MEQIPSASRATGPGELQAQSDAWLVHYNTHRRDDDDFMAGRRPLEGLDCHRKNKAA